MDSDMLNVEELENILSSMSDEEMQQLRNTAQTLFSSMSQQNQSKGIGKQEQQEGAEEKKGTGGFGLDFEAVSRIMQLMEKIRNRPDDPRCELLISLRPMLSPESQKKVDQAVRLLSLLNLLPLIRELGGE